MSKIDEIKARLRANHKRWLVTGVAGFIGSNLLEELLNLGQIVVGLDNCSTGYWQNLDDIEQKVGAQNWHCFTFYHGDIRNLSDCLKACEGVDYVLHQAALGSVPRSIDDPVATTQTNVDGFLNMLLAARDSGVRRFVYASSSATYGDHQDLPKIEDRIGNPLSPYALTKYVNELYADVFARTYGLESIGLRYFNVFGKRQDPNGAYAAVIPRWIGALLRDEQPVIYGDGETTRDFCYIDNVIEANLLAAAGDNGGAMSEVYNVAYGERTTLNKLFQAIKMSLIRYKPEVEQIGPIYGPFRRGDVRHSLADVTKARTLLGYEPGFDLERGLRESIQWYVGNLKQQRITPHLAGGQ